VRTAQKNKKQEKGNEITGYLRQRLFRTGPRFGRTQTTRMSSTIKKRGLHLGLVGKKRLGEWLRVDVGGNDNMEKLVLKEEKKIPETKTVEEIGQEKKKKNRSKRSP